MKRKHMVLSIASALLLGVAVLLSGCGEDPVAEITNLINEDFGSLETQSGKAYDAMLEGMNEANIDEVGLDTEKLAGALMADMSHSVDEVVVNDDTAVATITLTCKSFEDAFSVWLDKINAVAPEDVANMTEEEASEYALDLLFEAFEEVEAKDNVVELQFQKYDDGWHYAEEEELDGVLNALFGDALY